MKRLACDDSLASGISLRLRQTVLKNAFMQDLTKELQKWDKRTILTHLVSIAAGRELVLHATHGEDNKLSFQKDRVTEALSSITEKLQEINESVAGDSSQAKRTSSNVGFTKRNEAYNDLLDAVSKAIEEVQACLADLDTIISLCRDQLKELAGIESNASLT